MYLVRTCNLWLNHESNNRVIQAYVFQEFLTPEKFLIHFSKKNLCDTMRESRTLPRFWLFLVWCIGVFGVNLGIFWCFADLWRQRTTTRAEYFEVLVIENRRECNGHAQKQVVFVRTFGQWCILDLWSLKEILIFKGILRINIHDEWRTLYKVSCFQGCFIFEERSFSLRERRTTTKGFVFDGSLMMVQLPCKKTSGFLACFWVMMHHQCLNMDLFLEERSYFEGSLMKTLSLREEKLAQRVLFYGVLFNSWRNIFLWVDLNFDETPCFEGYFVLYSKIFLLDEGRNHHKVSCFQG